MEAEVTCQTRVTEPLALILEALGFVLKKPPLIYSVFQPESLPP